MFQYFDQRLPRQVEDVGSSDEWLCSYSCFHYFICNSYKVVIIGCLYCCLKRKYWVGYILVDIKLEQEINEEFVCPNFDVTIYRWVWRSYICLMKREHQPTLSVISHQEIESSKNMEFFWNYSTMFNMQELWHG